MGDCSAHEEAFTCDVCKYLSTELLNENYNIYTGMGRKVGHYIAGPAIQHLLTEGCVNIDKRISIRPFDDTMDEKKHQDYREKLLHESSIVVFIFGQHSDGTHSEGMLQEYEIAKRQGKYIIPVASTGFSSKIIWEDVQSNLTDYPYLEVYMEALLTTTNAKDISQLLLDIIQSIQ